MIARGLSAQCFDSGGNKEQNNACGLGVHGALFVFVLWHKVLAVVVCGVSVWHREMRGVGVNQKRTSSAATATTAVPTSTLARHTPEGLSAS